MNTFQGTGAVSRFVRVTALALGISINGCGGDDDKHYETYGQSEVFFRAAPLIIASLAGDLQLIASGSEWNIAFDRQNIRIDPITGQMTITPGTGTTARNLIVGFVLGAPKPEGGGFTTPATEWTPKTVWIFTDRQFISSQQITVRPGIAFTVFEDPPIAKGSVARATVEYVAGTRSALVSALVTWK